MTSHSPQPDREASSASSAGFASGAMDRTSPRTFAVGTGLCFQLAGGVLSLSSCCLWSLSGHLFDKTRRAPEHWIGHLSGAELPTGWTALCVIVGFVGGLAMVAAGVGMYGEYHSGARGGAVITGLMVLVFLIGAVVSAVTTGAPILALLPAGLAGLMLILCVLAGRSAIILKKHPPPPDRHIVTDEDVRELPRHRRPMD